MEYDKVWDYFDEIYCINLDHRKDRWEHSLKEFEKVGVLDRIIRVSAIRHEDGRIGLIKSFLKIFKEADAKNLKKILILEDDVEFINDPVETLKKSIEQAKDLDWTLFYFGGTMHAKCNKISSNLLKIRSVWATQAIAYHQRMYKQIIEQFEKTNIITRIEDINDVYLCNEIQNKNLSIMTYPMIATQYASYSDIENREVNYFFIEQHFNFYTQE